MLSWGRSERGSVPARPCVCSGPPREEPRGAHRPRTQELALDRRVGRKDASPDWPSRLARTLSPAESLPGAGAGVAAFTQGAVHSRPAASQGCSCGRGRALGVLRGRQSRASLPPTAGIKGTWPRPQGALGIRDFVSALEGWGCIGTASGGT